LEADHGVLAESVGQHERTLADVQVSFCVDIKYVLIYKITRQSTYFLLQ